MPNETEDAHVTVIGDARGFAQEIQSGAHALIADEPISFGGTDRGFSPYDLLLASLGSCTSMTIGYYARSRKWPLEKIVIALRHNKIHATDCEECETKEGKIDRIERDIQLIGALDDAQRKKLMEIADRCPVHRTLTAEIDIKTRAI